MAALKNFHTQMFVLLLVNTLFLASESLSLASFNVKMLGQKKMQDNDVVNTLVEIIQRYDIILIQEIRDKSGSTVEELLERVNDGDHLFEVELSERLGRTKSKEQFAFFYRGDHDIAVADTLHFDDSRDLFERDPFAVRFEVPHCNVPEFVLVAVHVDPDDAELEINSLVEVKGELQQRWFADNILFMGDLNADCKYFSKTAKEHSALTTDDYLWWISDDEDTTVSRTNCAYDRFVMVGDEFIDSVQYDTVGVFRFDEEFNMTQDTAIRISDHYPIEMELKECMPQEINPGSPYYHDDEL